MKRCEFCEYFVESSPGGGECHRHPPSHEYDDVGDLYVNYPEVRLADWCGEHNMGPQHAYIDHPMK